MRYELANTWMTYRYIHTYIHTVMFPGKCPWALKHNLLLQITVPKPNLLCPYAVIPLTPWSLEEFWKEWSQVYNATIFCKVWTIIWLEETWLALSCLINTCDWVLHVLHGHLKWQSLPYEGYNKRSLPNHVLEKVVLIPVALTCDREGVASSPGPLRGGERAWYTLFAHALLS